MKETPYELKLRSEKGNGEKLYNFVSADGVSSKRSFREAEIVLADHIEFETDDQVVVFGNGFGFLPVIFGDYVSYGEVLAIGKSDRSTQLKDLNLKENNIENVRTRKNGFCKNLTNCFDKAIYAPEGYDSIEAVKKRITNLVSALDTQGNLFIAGRKTDGIKRYRDHLNAIGGELEKIAQEGNHRAYRFTKTSESDPKSVKIEDTFEVEIAGHKLSFTTCEGLFSPKSLDEGTRLLIENVEVEEGDVLLDLACGYGAISASLSKSYEPGALFMSDDDQIACIYARRNMEKNSVSGFNLKNRDCLDGFSNQKFDLIVSNPPTHQGKGVTDEIFHESHESLRDGGRLVIVYNQNMEFENKLKQVFSKTRVLEERNNYKVLEATK